MFDETPSSTKSQASNTCQSCELLALLAGNLNLQLTIQSHKTSRFCSPQKIFPPRQLDARRSWLVPLALGQVPLLTETGERLLPRHVIRRRSWLIVPLLTEGIGVLPRHAIRRRSWLIVPLLTEGTGVLPRHVIRRRQWLIVPLLTEGTGDAARRQSWLVPLTLGQVPLLTEGTGVIPWQANCAVLKFGAVLKFVFAALDLNHCNKTLTFGCLQPRSSVEVPLYTVSGSTQQLLARLGATPPTHSAACIYIYTCAHMCIHMHTYALARARAHAHTCARAQPHTLHCARVSRSKGGCKRASGCISRVTRE